MTLNKMANFNEFINYCLDFYGAAGIYPENKRTKEQIAYATTLYLWYNIIIFTKELK